MVNSPAIPDLSVYAGRWVAMVVDSRGRAQVAGAGYTAEEAERLAQHNRPKERLILRFVDAAEGRPLALHPLLEQLRPLLTDRPQPVYLVGGAVRDALLARASHDLDFVVPGQAIPLAFQVGNALGWPAYVLDRARDTGRVVVPGNDATLDFARLRGADLEADLRDRDFTINALALPVTATTDASLIDPCGGLADLAAGQLRPVHARSLEDDPIRALRGPRLALELGLALAPETAVAIQQALPLLGEISPERQRDELIRLLGLADPGAALAALHEHGLLAVIWPELAELAGVAQSAPHHEPVLAHTISVLRRLAAVEQALTSRAVPDDPALAAAQARLMRFGDALAAHLARPVDGGVNGRLLLRLGALFHDVGKRVTQTVDQDGRIRFIGHDDAGNTLAATALRRYRFSNQAIDHVRRIVAGHMRPLHLLKAGQVSRRAAYRFYRATGTAGLDIGLLSLADHLATYDGPGPTPAWPELIAVIESLLLSYFEQKEEVVRPQPLLNGLEVISLLGLEAGPAVGQVLRQLEEAQAAGEVDSRDAAVAFIRSLPRD